MVLPGCTHLPVTSTNFVGSGKAIVHVNNGTIHGCLFDGLAGELNVLRHQQEDDLVRDHLLDNGLVQMECKGA